jgi:hypothetical protein
MGEARFFRRETVRAVITVENGDNGGVARFDGFKGAPAAVVGKTSAAEDEGPAGFFEVESLARTRGEAKWRLWRRYASGSAGAGELGGKARGSAWGQWGPASGGRARGPRVVAGC